MNNGGVNLGFCQPHLKLLPYLPTLRIPTMHEANTALLDIFGR